MARILIAEPYPEVRELLSLIAKRLGHTPVVRRGEALPDVDLMVAEPAAPGSLELAHALRAAQPGLPIVVVSFLPQPPTWTALEPAAYVLKPFGRQELVARVQALLRRAQAGTREAPSTYADGFLSIDFGQHAVAVGDREVSLTPLEFRLLAAFVRHPRQVLSREQLLELVWGDAYGVAGDQVKLYVGYLRRKLDPTQPESVPIETVRGFGYRYRPPTA